MKINNLGAKWRLILEFINKGYCTQSEIIENSNGVLNGGVYIGLATLEEVGLIKKVNPEQFNPIAYISPSNTPIYTKGSALKPMQYKLTDKGKGHIGDVYGS